MMNISHHLTSINPEFDRRVDSTFAGQASWAIDSTRTCRECAFWTGCGRGAGRRAASGIGGSELKPRPCSKYRDLMNGAIGTPVPHSATACKFFLENPNPPAAYARDK
jgi:hypothetical protein